MPRTSQRGPNDYQHGHCHNFAVALMIALRKKFPDAEYCLITGNRNEEEILVHAYVKVGKAYIDSDGLHTYLDVCDRLDEWMDEQAYNNTLNRNAAENDGDEDFEEDDYNADIEEDAEGIPDMFFGGVKCCFDTLSQDIKAFLDRPDIQQLERKQMSKRKEDYEAKELLITDTKDLIESSDFEQEELVEWLLWRMSPQQLNKAIADLSTLYAHRNPLRRTP